MPPLAVPPSTVEEMRAIEFNMVQEHKRRLFYTVFFNPERSHWWCVGTSSPLCPNWRR